MERTPSAPIVQRRSETHLCAVRSADPHPGDPVGAVANELRHRGLVDHLSPCGGCGIDEQPVEEMATRRVQCVDAVAWSDGDLDLLTVGIVEDDSTDGRRVCRDDIGEQAPSRQLQDSAAHQTVGRDRVAPAATVFHQDNSDAGAGEQ